MQQHKKTSLAGLFLIVLFVFSFQPLAFSASPVDDWPKKPSHYVTDQANLIDAGSERALNGYLQELEQKSGIQFVVVTVDSLEGESKESFALAITEHWRLGRKGTDEGLLFLIAKQEKLYRFETGYGLEGLLPDSYLGTVGRKRLIPLMKKGRSSEAILAATITVIGTIAKGKGISVTGMPKLKRLSGRKRGGSWMWLFMVLFWIVPTLGRRRRGLSGWRGGAMRGGMLYLLLGGMGGMSGGRSGGMGGGFGSFGGGGGGGFGGGGAGGGW